MADLNTALFRIDPTEGLQQYVQAVKPFHSKVLDVLVEYVYAEAMSVTAVDRLYTSVGLEEVSREVTRTGGYGYVWGAYDLTPPGDLPHATILAAEAQISVDASFTSGSSVIQLGANPSDYGFPVGSPVIFRTSESLPSEIEVGHIYFIVTSAFPSITVSSTFGGSPITFSSSAVGATISPVGLPFNSFLVAMPAATQYDVVITDLMRNQLAFATPHAITNVDTTLNRFTASGVAGLLNPGDVVYVSGNTDPATDGKYTVSATSGSHITVVEPLSLTVTVTGDVYIPLAPDDVPYWPRGAAVSITSSGTYPIPTSSADTYYFSTTPQIGSFNLSTRRYVQQYADIVNITTRPQGRLKLFRVEPFVPGEQVAVTGSADNDGIYTINTIQREGSNFRIYVLEPIRTPSNYNSTSDGTMTYAGSYGDPYSAIASAPDLYTATFFSERIEFTFLDSGPPPPPPPDS